VLSQEFLTEYNEITLIERKNSLLEDEGTRGNNGALFMGRFSPPTKAHMKIIDDASKKYDTVTLNIVKSGKVNSENPFPLELQISMWQNVFPNLEIQLSKTGYLPAIIEEAVNNIRVVLAGSDRKASYEKQLEKMPEVHVEEIPRTGEDISASKVRQALIDDDVETFKQMMHPGTYEFYNELKQFV